MYVISDIEEKRYIKFNANSGYEFVANKQQAYKFSQKEKAQNLIINNLNGRFKTLNITFKIVELEEEKDIDFKPYHSQIDYIEEIADEEIQPTLPTTFNYDLTVLADMLTHLPKDLTNEKIKLNNQLIHICRAICDLNHHRLLNGSMSASRRCNRDTLTTKLIDKRQEIKDELLLIEIIEARLSGEDIKGRVKGMDGRKYAPREFDRLFETNEMPNFDEWWESVK